MTTPSSEKNAQNLDGHTIDVCILCTSIVLGHDDLSKESFVSVKKLKGLTKPLETASGFPMDFTSYSPSW